jgi:hypothetical protein
VSALIGWWAAWTFWTDLERTKAALASVECNVKVREREDLDLAQAAQAFIQALMLTRNAHPIRFHEWHVEMPKEIGDAYVRLVQTACAPRGWRA